MNSSDSSDAVTVLIVSRHEAFTAAASQQLAASGHTARILAPGEAPLALQSEAPAPGVALVDCDAETTDGSPMRHALRAALPDCAIILVCTPDQASQGAGLVRSGEAWDYLLTDTLDDPNRFPLLLERAGTRRTATDPDDTAAQYQEVLQALAEMRELLRDGVDNPIAKLLGGLKFGTSSSHLGGDLLAAAAAGMEDCLPEFIAGRLRRLENQVLLWGREGLCAATGLATSRILVVEDDSVSAELAEHILQRHGFEVTVAKTAVAAKEALGECPPDLVLMDIHLGDANGLELIKRLRVGSICPNVPVIVTTSDRMRDTLLDAVDLDVQGYVLKPYQPALLVEKVTTVLAASKKGMASVAG